MSKSVEEFWTAHTVRDVPFTSAQQSLDYLKWRSDIYPMAYEMMGLYGEHKDEVILDFGCGPANDLIGFLVETKAKKIIGMDVSPFALSLASRRLLLHGFGSDRVVLVQSEDNGIIDLQDAIIDHVNCQGVLHHVSEPQKTLNEFYRVLKPGGSATIMVYNYNSLYLHLYVAYRLQIQSGKDAGLEIKDAFSRNTDGPDCPIAYPYTPEEFTALCENAGFSVDYKGGYFADLELDLLKTIGEQAVYDIRLAEEHREFLRELTVSPRGYPMYSDFTAGVGGVYLLSK